MKPTKKMREKFVRKEKQLKSKVAINIQFQLRNAEEFHIWTWFINAIHNFGFRLLTLK